jgi:radical SAM protein with 4Fe4S-binding SPASM domain
MNKRKFKKVIKRIVNLPLNLSLFKYLLNKTKHISLKLSGSTRVAYPSTIMLELSNHCNLHCTTCPREYDYGKDMDKGYMDPVEAKKIIEEVWPYLDSIGLTGMGETFLYREIEEIVNYIRSKSRGIIISVSTNAMVPGFIKKTAPLINKIDTIQVSIDGLDEVYEKIRLNANFKTLDDNLDQLVELCRYSGTDLMLNMVVTKENYFQMPALVDYAAEKGIEYLDFTLFNLACVTNLDRSYYDFYESEKFINTLGNLDKAAERNRHVIITGRNFKTENGFRKCPFPWTHYYICWNGFVTPCCAKPFPKELNFGNVFESGVLNVLNSESFRNFRVLWKKNITPSFCEKCHFIDIKPVKSTIQSQ